MEDKPVGEPRTQTWGPGCGRGNWGQIVGRIRLEAVSGGRLGLGLNGPADCIGTLPVLVLFLIKGLRESVYFWAQSIT